MASNKRIRDKKGECVSNKAWLDEPELRDWIGAAVDNSGAHVSGEFQTTKNLKRLWHCAVAKMDLSIRAVWQISR